MRMQSERQEAGEGKKAFHGCPMLQTPCQTLFTLQSQFCRDCVKESDAELQPARSTILPRQDTFRRRLKPASL